MHQIRFRLGLRSRPYWGSLQRSPKPPTWILGVLLLREARGGEVAKKGKEVERTKTEKGKERDAGPSLHLPNSLRHWVRRAHRGVRDSG